MSDDLNELDAPPAAVPVSTPEEAFPISFSSAEPIDVTGFAEKFDINASQEGTRAKIAMNFTHWFLFLVALVIVGPFIVNLYNPKAILDPLASSKELVTVLGSVLAGPFGFIVGFYFKQSTDKQS